MFETLHIPSIESTHSWALAQDKSTLSHPLMITADEQTKSIGRRKNTTWIAPKKTSLLATFAIPNFKSTESHNLAQLLACSLISVTNSYSIFPLFKWPNDLLVSNRKIGGAMADIGSHAVVISGGLNINSSSDDLKKVDIPATSLFIETGQKYDIPQFAEKLAAQFSDDLTEFQANGFAKFAQLMNKYLAYKDLIVSVEGPKKISGTLKEICPDGRLKLDCDGFDEIIVSGSLHSNY